MSSLKQASDAGAEDSVKNQSPQGATQTVTMEPLLEAQCTRHENAADCDWACGHFSLVGSELVQTPECEQAPAEDESTPEGGLNRESVNGDHPLQMGGSLTPVSRDVNGDGKSGHQARSEGGGGYSHSPEKELSQRMKHVFLTGIEKGGLSEGQLGRSSSNQGTQKGGLSEGQPARLSHNQSGLSEGQAARLTPNQRTQSGPPPDLCQMEKKEGSGRVLEKTASGTSFTSFWRRPALQLFRKPEEGQVAPSLKDARSYTSPVASRATSPTSLGRRAAARTVSAPLNVSATKVAGSQQVALRNTPSPAQKAVFRSPESSPDAFSYAPRSHQHVHEDEHSVNAPPLHKARSEPPQWKQQQQPETVVENVEWNMDEEEEEEGEESPKGQSKNLGGQSENVGGQSELAGGHSGSYSGQFEKRSKISGGQSERRSEVSGGRSEKSSGQAGPFDGRSVYASGQSGNFGGQSGNFGGGSETFGARSRTEEGLGVWGSGKVAESQFSNAPSWIDYSTMTEGYRQPILETPHETKSQTPARSVPGGSDVSGSLGVGSEGRKKRRRNWGGKGRKKTPSESGTLAEAGDNDSAASDVSSVQGASLPRSSEGVARRVGNKIDVNLKRGGPDSSSGKSTGADVAMVTSAGGQVQKGARLHPEGGSSERGSVNVSVSEPREPRLAGDRWQHVICKESEEGREAEEAEDIELVEEEDNDSDAPSDDLSDADAEEANQELTRGSQIRDDYYHAQSAQTREGVRKGEETVEENENDGWESERRLGLNKWHVVAMIGCSILTAFVGGRFYFEHLRRQEAKRRAERTCRIPVPFGFGEVEVVEVLRPLVCPKDHRGYV